MERDSMDRKVKKMRAFQGEKDGQNRNLSSALSKVTACGLLLTEVYMEGARGRQGRLREREREGPNELGLFGVYYRLSIKPP